MEAVGDSEVEPPRTIAPFCRETARNSPNGSLSVSITDRRFLLGENSLSSVGYSI